MLRATPAHLQRSAPVAYDQQRYSVPRVRSISALSIDRASFPPSAFARRIVAPHAPLMIEAAVTTSTMNITDLESCTREQLLGRAREMGVRGISALKKQDIILRIVQAASEAEGSQLTGGILEVVDDSYGFLRGESLLPRPPPMSTFPSPTCGATTCAAATTWSAPCARPRPTRSTMACAR